MNRLHLTLLVFLAFQPLFAQNQASFFKVPYTPTAADPLWVQLMYADNPNFDEVVEAFHAYQEEHPKEKTIHTQNFKYWVRKVQPYVQGDGFIRLPSEEEARAFEEAMRQQRRQAPSGARNQLWQDVGPARTYRNDGQLNQRPTQVNIYCLGIAPSNPDIMYCAGETGGVFKSTDHALNWVSVSKDENFTNAQDIKVHPNNPDIVYVATAQHVYKTLDGGASWSIIFSFSNGVTVEQFYIHRTNTEHIYTATSNGLHWSTDGGSTWSQLMAGRFWDIEAHVTNPDILFVSRHNPSLKRAEIWKSLDAGASWELKDNNWYMPANIAQASDQGCKIALTPADPDRVYCGLIGESKAGDAGWIGVYYSLDGGNSWVNPTGTDGGPYVAGDNQNTNWYVAGYYSGTGNHYHQGWYNFDLVASDVNPDRIWIGTIWFCESNDRGASIEYVRGTRNLEMHADIQDMEVLNGELWVASDGGLNFSTTEAQSVEIRNNGISASDYWGFDQGWNEDTYVGGRYHNGDAVYHENYGLGNSLFLGGAEQATGYINQLDNRETHFSDITDKVTPDDLTLIAANTFDYALYPNESYVLLNSSEVHCDPRYANHLYLGRDHVFYKSTSGGTVFSPLFTFPADSRVLELEVGRDNPERLYCVVRNANQCTIFRSDDGGQNFTACANLPTNTSRVDITVNPQNSNEIWANAQFGSNGNKIFSSADGGLSWQNRTTPSLNGQNFVDILYQGGTDGLVYIASRNQVYYWNASEWINYADNLPFVVSPLHFRAFYRDQKLRLASARGIWEAPLAASSAPIAQPMTFTDKVYCARDTVQFDCYSILHHEGAQWQWSFSPQPQYISNANSRNPRVVLGAQGAYTVTLTVTDDNGQSSSKTVENMVVLEDHCSRDTVPGLALRCSNDGDYANVPNLQLGETNTFTISAWIKPEGIQNEYTGIVMADGDAAGINFRPDMQLAYHWPGGQWWWNSGLFVEPNVWSHVALVVSPGSITVYLNGVGATHAISPQVKDMQTMKIGSYQAWGGRNFRGEIDEVCLWNRVLTQAEIRELRHLTRTGPTPFLDDLVAYYQFNLPDASIVNDRMGTKHASLNGNAQKVPSSAPIGGGLSDRVPVSSGGSIFFPNTQTSIQLNAGVTANAELVVTRIHLDPNEVPDPANSLGQYWIVNHYGAPLADAVEGLEFGLYDIQVGGSPSEMMLSSRMANAHEATWQALCAAESHSGSAIQFGNSCEPAAFGQFAISAPELSVQAEEARAKAGATLSVFPNPGAGQFTLNCTVCAGETLEVFNAAGQVVHTAQLTEGSQMLNLTHVPDGVYVLKWRAGQKQSARASRLVKISEE